MTIVMMVMVMMVMVMVIFCFFDFAGDCVCRNGWTGPTCNTSCPQGYWGRNCTLPCPCTHGAQCNPTNGKCECSGNCQCDPGWTGAECTVQCLLGTWGPNCSRLCTCKNSGGCDRVREQTLYLPCLYLQDWVLFKSASLPSQTRVVYHLLLCLLMSEVGSFMSPACCE